MRREVIFTPLLAIPVISLCVVSLFLILSTTPLLFNSQLGFFIIGIILYLFFAFMDIRIWQKFIPFLYAGSLILLFLSFFGPNVRGATRWLDIYGIRLQPSEIIKPFMIIFFSYFVARHPPTKFINILKSSLLFLPVILLIFKEPDLGNVLVYMAFFMAILIMGGIPWRYIFLSILGTAAFFPLGWLILAPYQRQRLSSFLNPSSDPAGTGYNALQAIVAIGSGQLMGLGLGKGTQSKLMFLPEYHTDFVFASLSEELGLIGGVFVLLFYFVFLFKLISIAQDQSNPFMKLIVTGIFAQIFIQIFINVGMNLGLLPITGITLPLISYGGSSILSTFMELGLVMAIHNQQKHAPLVIS